MIRDPIRVSRVTVGTGAKRPFGDARLVVHRQDEQTHGRELVCIFLIRSRPEPRGNERSTTMRSGRVCGTAASRCRRLGLAADFEIRFQRDHAREPFADQRMVSSTKKTRRRAGWLA